MHDFTLVTYDLHSADTIFGDDADWQLNWHVEPSIVLPSLPLRGVARSADQSYPPQYRYDAGIDRREATIPQLRDAARSDLADMLGTMDSFLRPWAEKVLADPDELDCLIRQHLGVAHPYALCAPLSVTTLDEATRLKVDADQVWESRCSSAVVRATMPDGYRIWIGIGSHMQDVGRCDEYRAAEAAAVGAVYTHRRNAIAKIREILDGWSDDTPYYSATMGTAYDQLPIRVYRGPVSSQDLPGASPYGGGSWDLPEVAVYRGKERERYDDRKTWSDDESRERQRERERQGQARRNAEVQAALDDLRTVLPESAFRVTGLVPGLRVSGLPDAVTAGPVRMREDGRFGLALVRYGAGRNRRSTWVALGRVAKIVED